jgi:hypothetical protein
MIRGFYTYNGIYIHIASGDWDWSLEFLSFVGKRRGEYRDMANWGGDFSSIYIYGTVHAYIWELN